MNGTPAASLLEDLCEAMNALRATQEKLAAAAPNGRDYYSQAPGAFARAQDEHSNRVERLQGVLDELYQMAEHVSAEADRRKR